MAGNDQIRYSVGFDVQQNDLKQLKATLDQLKKQLTDIKNVKIGDIAKINNVDNNEATKYLIDIKNHAENVENALRKAFNVRLNAVNIKQFNQALQDSGSSMQKIYESFSKAGIQGEQAFRNLTTSVFRTTTQLRESHAVLDKIAQTLTRTLGWNLASSAVNSLTRSVQQAWGYVKSLDTSLNNISVVTGKSADQMADFAVKANNAAQALGKTTTDYTNAALIYAQQGLNDKEIEARTAITLKAANVTGQSTEAVSQELTAVWNGYKVNADEAELYVDRLAAVAATTASDLEELSTGMSKVASAAAAMGVGEDQLAAQLSTIISVTKQAPESVGTALRTVYARISDIQAGIEEDGVTLGNYSGEMANLGFNVLDASGHLRDMGTVIEQIGGKWQDLTRQQQVNLAQVMAGQRQYSNLIALFDNFDQYSKALETAQNASGTLQSQQDIYMESTAAHLNELKAATENIYDSLINPNAMDGVLDDFTNLANAIAKVVDSLGGGGQVLKSLFSVGLMAFSTQLANSLNTTATNFAKASFQAEQFRTALASLEEAKGTTNNPISRSLFSNTEQLSRLSRFMTPEQLQVAQAAVSKLEQDIKGFENIEKDLSEIQTAAEKAGLKIKELGDITDDFQNKAKALNIKTILGQLSEAKGSDKKDNIPLFEKAQGIGDQISEAIKQELIASSPEINKILEEIVTLPTEAGEGQSWDNLIDRYKNKFQELKDALSAQGINGGFLTELENLFTKKNLDGKIDETQEKFKKFTESAAQGIQGMQEMGNNLQRAFNIESIVKFTGSMTTLLNVSQQIKNLGSIWADNTLSGSEKAFQTFHNILLTVSMALPAIKRLNDAIKTLTLSQIKETVAAGAATIASKAKAVASAAVAKVKQIEARRTREAAEADTEEAITSGVNAAQNTAQAAASGAGAVSGAAGAGAAGVGAAGGLAALGGPITAAVVGITLLIGVIGAVTAAIKKNHQELVKEKQESLEQQKEIQNEIDKNQQLISSIEDLANKRKNGEITRSESIASIKELIEQYGLEKEAIDELAESYDNLSGYVAEQRAKAAKEAVYAAQQRQADAEFLLHDKANNSKYGTDYGDEYYLLTHTPSKETKGEDKLLDILNNTEGVNNLGLGQYSIAVGNTTQGLIKAWNTTQEIRKQVAELVLKGQLTWDDIKGSVVQPMLNWNKELAPLIEQGKASLDNTSEKLDLFYSSQAMEAMPADFSNIENLSNFIDQWQKLKKETEEKLIAAANEGTDVSGIKASEATDAFIEEYYKDLYLQYGQFTKFMDDTENKLKTAMPESLKEIFSGMSGQQLSAFLKLDLSTLKDWESIAKYAQRIANADVEHTAEALNINPDALQEEAAEKYSQYQEIEDKVREGKGLNKNQFESLDSDLQDFFYTAANGSHKLKVSAQEFFNAIDDKKLKGFSDNLDLINRDLEKVQNLKTDGWNPDAYEGIDRSAALTPGSEAGLEKEEYYNKELVNNQLKYLEVLGLSDEALRNQVEIWKDAYYHQGLSLKQVEEIYKKVAELKDQTIDLDEVQQERLRQQTEAYHQLHDAMFPTDSDVDQGALQSLSSVIQEMADSSAELDNNLDQDTRAADDLSEAILRFDDAITDVTDNYDDWLAALSSGAAQDQAAVIDGLRDAYADLLDLDGSSLSQGFLKSADNLQLMKAAIDGNIEAYDQLMSMAQQDIAAQVHLDTENFQIGFDHLMDMYYQGQSLEDMQIGASLDNQDFLDGLTQMVNAAGMTAQQATDYLASMGVDAEVVQQKTTGTETSQKTGFEARWQANPAPFRAPVTTGLGFTTQTIDEGYLAQNLTYAPVPSTVTDTKENTAFSLKVTSAHKSSGGGFKYSQASHGGGAKHPTSKGSGGKGGGGKGGGSGKAPEPDTSQKDRKKDLQDTRDIYHDINVELKQINRELKRAQQKQDRLYGKQLLDNLNEQNRILEKNKVTLQEKHKIQEQDLKTQQEALKNLGVTFDAYGNIANYMDILGRKQAQITAETAKYNSLIDAYNASTDKDLKKALADEAGKIDKKIKEFDDEYKNLEKKIKNYDSLREAMEDVVDQIEEQTQKQIEINIKKFRMAVEIQLEMGQAERDWNKFRREVLEHTDVLKGTEFEEIFANARQSFNDVFSYFDVHGTKGSLQALTEQLMATRAEIEAINETGKSAIYGDNKAQAMEDLQKDLDELMGQMEDVQGLIDDIGKAYLDTIDDIADQFDKQIEDYEYVGDLIEHDIDLLSLLYGDKNYDAMQKYYDALARNNLKQLDSLKQQRDFWKQEWEEAVARGDSKAAEQFEQNYKETIENLNDLIEDSAKTIQDKYVNAIDKIFDELDKKISNGKGTDYLSTQWDLMNKNAEEYLDTINSAFAIQETERKYQKAIDESKNIKSQQTLKKLMDDQLNILRNKEKVSQYDVDRAEKLLQVEQARIALQDAQSAKTTMRLKRDSQGNYSYQYVADNNAVDDARDNLAQAQNDLYNFDKERYQSVLNDMLAAWKDFQSEYKEILEDTSLAEEERIEKLALLREEYGEYINDKTAQNAEARNNLMESAFADMAALYNTDVANYNQMSIDEQNILMGDLVPAWESGIQQMSDKVAGEGGFIPVCEQAFDSITEATKDYEEQLDNMANAAGISLDYVTQGVDLLSYAFENLIENNDDLIDRMQSEVDAIETLQDVARGLADEYQNVYNEAKTAVSEIHNFIQEEQGRAAAYAETANAAIESYNRTAQAYAEAYDQMASAFENYAARVRAAASGDSSSGGSNGGNGGGSNGSSPSGGSSTPTSSSSKSSQQDFSYVDFMGRIHKNGKIVGYADQVETGGYTGDWNSSEGRVAMLHQKQLVLNKEDTKNFLEGTYILREISSSLKGSLSNRINNISLMAPKTTADKEELEQNVHIEASFPNVNSKKEIEEAFNDLVNLAAQRAMRNN